MAEAQVAEDEDGLLGHIGMGAAEVETVTTLAEKYGINWSRYGESWPQDSRNRINIANVGLGMAQAKFLRLSAEKKYKIIDKRQRGG